MRELFGFIWTVASTAIVRKLLTPGLRRYGISIAIDLILGWSVLVVLQPVISAVSISASVLLLVAGGLL